MSKVFGRRRRDGVAAKKAVPAPAPVPVPVPAPAPVPVQTNEDWFTEYFVSPSDTRPEKEIQARLEEVERQTVVALDRRILWMAPEESLLDDQTDSPFVTICDRKARMWNFVPVRKFVLAILKIIHTSSEVAWGTDNGKGIVVWGTYNGEEVGFHFKNMRKSPESITVDVSVFSPGKWIERLSITVVSNPSMPKSVMVNLGFYDVKAIREAMRRK